MRRWLAVTVVIAVLAAGPMALYKYTDPETLDLDDTVRRQTPGRFVQLTDGITHYELAGPMTGPVVVLAAGFSVPYYIWDPTFAALTEAGIRVLRYDYYGRGFSDRPDTRYDQAFYIRQLAELLNALHVTEPIDLVGLSLGGSIVTSVADQYPDRVRSIVYVDPSFRTPETAPAGSAAVWSVLTAILTERGWANEQLADFLHPERFPDWPDRYRVQMQYRGFRLARLAELTANADVDQRDEIARVGKHERPVLAIWGRQDPVVPFEESAQLLDAMPRARLVTVDDSGHLPQWEQPAVFHTALLSFLRAVNGTQDHEDERHRVGDRFGSATRCGSSADG